LTPQHAFDLLVLHLSSILLGWMYCWREPAPFGVVVAAPAPIFFLGIPQDAIAGDLSLLPTKNQARPGVSVLRRRRLPGTAASDVIHLCRNCLTL
jgi:hypothetical protein